MRNKRLVASILILAEILLCAGMISVSWLGVQQAAASGVHLRLFQFDRISAEAQQDWRFEVDRPSRLVVVCEAGRVEISGGAENEVTVTAHKTAWDASQEKARAALDRMNVQVSQEGGTVTVRYSIDPEFLVVGQSRLDTVDFTIQAPDGVIVEASTTSGDLSLSGLSGEASLDSEFGEITVNDLEGELLAASNSGSIEARGIQAGQGGIRLEAEFGDIRLEEATADKLEVHSNSGAMRLNDIEVSGEILLDSEFGEVVFKGGHASRLTVESNSGGVTLSDLSITGELVANSEFGGLALIEVSAASYDLASNSGTIDVERAQGKIKAHSEFGGIQITRAEAANLDLKSNNGPIEFSGSLGDGPHNIETEFSNVQLSLPPDSALAIDLATEFGQIQSAFDVTRSGEMDSKHWRGEINGGGAALSIQSNNGTITLEILE
ncbi:MAG: DUF4097 family beta strand repeat protein [Anaerolineales bacterium]|nr:DUF4097 family beta strand repeat protein [Anaerolineales bacterium]